MSAEVSSPRFDIKRVIISGFKCIREPLTIDITRKLSILVGDNGVGKSTILEAIHLALTGMYRGEPIRKALSESLFNNNDVAAFVTAVSTGDFSKLPFIKIEVFLCGGDGHDAEYLSGGVNSEKQKNVGSPSQSCSTKTIAPNWRAFPNPVSRACPSNTTNLSG